MDARDLRVVIQPRMIRLRDAPAFFGMDKTASIAKCGPCSPRSVSV